MARRSYAANTPASAEPGRRGLALLLAGLAMLGPFAVDTYLPAFTDIEQSLQATPFQVQQTLTAYMFSFGFMTLWHGALADAMGRRVVILASLFVFAIASLGCAAAHRIEYLWAFRIVQGLSAGAGVVVGRAIIRDLYAGTRAAQLLSLVTMIFAVAPAIAPVLGGWLVRMSEWRVIFLFLFAYSGLMLYLSHVRLPETLPPEQRLPFVPKQLWVRYRRVFTSALFHMKSGVIALNFAGLFLYVAAAPVFLTRQVGLREDQFAWQFVPMVAGIFLGALAANRMAGRVAVGRQVAIGFVCMVSAAGCNLAYHLAFPPAIPWSTLPLLLYTCGMSIVAPVVTLLVMDLFTDIRGLVASCQAFVQTMLGAAVAGLVAPALANNAVSLAMAQLLMVTGAVLLWQIGAMLHDRTVQRARHTAQSASSQ